MLVSLRPRGGHDGLRRAAARHGGGLIALSPWTLRCRDDAATRAALQGALAADAVVFTSPAAVHAAARLHSLDGLAAACAVGSGTAAALHRCGVRDVQKPTRMDSEGLLALPALAAGAASRVGLVTAPGGRGLLAPALSARGLQVVRADVYDRVPVAPNSRALAALRRSTAPWVLAVSSAEALQRVLAELPDDLCQRLRASAVVAASERLAAVAAAQGFKTIAIARSPRPADLAAAAQAQAGTRVPVA